VPVAPHDDLGIDSAGVLVRHIHPTHIVPDENIGGKRISSAAFSATSGDPDNGMSVDIGQKLIADGKALDAMVKDGLGAVSLPVGGVRELGLKVGPDPDLNIDPPNPYHGQVWPVKSSTRSKLHKIVIDWVRALPGVALR
jgi:hypothetical protein